MENFDLNQINLNLGHVWLKPSSAATHIFLVVEAISNGDGTDGGKKEEKRRAKEQRSEERLCGDESRRGSAIEERRRR